MEISNISRIGVGLGRRIAVIAILAASACASAEKRGDAISATEPSAKPSTPSAANEIYGPFPSGGEVVGPPAPVEMISNPDRIVLVFGRGLAHGYAYVGVLRALHELKVPIHAIYATEVGALAGALYLTQPNPNRVDWALLRFNEKNLGPTSGKFSFRLSSPEKELESKLREVFGERRVETLAERIHVELADAKTGEALVARSGDLWRAIRGALAGANGFDPIDFEGRPVKASDRALLQEAALARSTEKYPILVVSAGEVPPESLRRTSDGGRALVLHVPLVGIDDLDLKKRNQAVFSGKSAILKAAPAVLGLVGRKPE